jgi:glycosyltransferase involved in cell wall biosynthesis
MMLPPIEGHHTASRRIIEAALCAGINSHVITIEPQAETLESPRNWIIVNSKYYADNTNDVGFVSSTFRIFHELFASVDIASHVKFSNSDIVHILNVNKEAYVVCHKLLRVRKPLLLHFFHSPYVLTDDIFLVRNLALRIGLYGRVLNNHVLTINLSLFKFLIEELGIDQEHVHYVPCPIDTDIFKPLKNKKCLREKYGLPIDRPIVVYVGSLNPARGVSTLIKSLPDVLHRFPEALLYISHPRHETERTYEAQVYELVQDLQLKKSVVMAGPSPYVEEIYNLADVLVLPFSRSYWVDPPLVLLEAMSCGVPVITSSLGAISEVVREDENAVVVNPSDQESLAKAIVSLINDPLEASRVGEKARETIVQTNSYEVVGKKLLKIYSSVIR